MQKASRWLIITLLCALIVACGGNRERSVPVEEIAEAETQDGESAETTTREEHGHDHAVDPALFLREGLVSDITVEPCTLSGGTETSCYRFSVSSTPEYTPGPWCPTNITDSAELGGIWPENGEINDVDGAFIENLAAFYNDAHWKLYNDDGSINYTDSIEACDAAARPNVDPAYQNYCVQCLPSYVEADESGARVTYVIPIMPVKAEMPTRIGASGVGVAFNGVKFDAPAPTNDILRNYTLAPFDDCGGHVNPVSGYHYHMHTGCSTEIVQDDGHAPMIGYALDGYPLYARLDANGEESTGLDECRGQEDAERGYHYHVDYGGNNMFIGCYTGEIGCTFSGSGEGQICDASANPGGRRPGPGGGPEGGGPGGAPEGGPGRGPEGGPGGGPEGSGPEGGRGPGSGPSGGPEDGRGPGGGPEGGLGGGPRGGPPDFAAAAEILGITERALMDALGGPPPDFAAAAEKLGISEQELHDALGGPPPPKRGGGE